MRVSYAWLLAVCCAACGSSFSAPDGGLDGGNGPGTAKLSATSIDFGPSDCGGPAPAAQNVTLTNVGGGALSWSATMDASDEFSLQGTASGTLDPGASAPIAVAAKAIAPDSKAGAMQQTTIRLSTSDPALSAASIAVSITASGAQLSLAPSTVDFGQTPVGAQAPEQMVTVTNSGNAAADVTASTDVGPFGVGWTGAPAPLHVDPGKAGVLSARFQPTTAATASGTLSLQVAGAVCGGAPTPVMLTGLGVSGVVGISPGSLDFGLVDCGKQAAAKTLTIFNTGNMPFKFTAALMVGASYDLSASSGTILAQAQSQLIVTPHAIPATSAVTPDLYADTLIITTDIPMDTPHDVPLHETAQGAILSWSPGSLPFGSVQVGQPAMKTATLTNMGNATAGVTPSTGGAPFSVSPSVLTPIAGGGATLGATVTVTATPPALGAHSDMLTVATGDVLCAPLPAPVTLDETSIDAATDVASGSGSACATGTSGAVYCWGGNFYGQIGDGTTTERDAPVPASGLSDATAVTVGGQHACAIRKAGTADCWGYDYYGQLGEGTTTDSHVPVAVNLLNGVTSLAAGQDHTCAVASGMVSCWGYNASGQLGDGTTSNSSTPVAVGGVMATAVCAGTSHSCALLASGGVACWGGNSSGQLGNGTTVQSLVPVAVASITTATAITCGASHTCALLASGDLRCWGDNAYGEIGDGTTTQRTSPVAVTGLMNVTGVAAGQSYTCARRNDSTAWCWGANWSGGLGDGTTTQRDSPVQVSSLSDALRVSAGGETTCAVETGGALSCWGADWSGQLGNGSHGSNSLVPGPVVDF